MAATLERLVHEWLLIDQNPVTRSEIKHLWDAGNTLELEKRMSTRIEFGTAGLRGRMEAGWSRMNDLIILQASQGLCAYVLQTIKEATSKGVVIGHDHRHNSERWANMTAGVFTASGMKVYRLQGFVPTPLVPFSIQTLQAACGVMITASHNPKDDNGYKVYWENAVQIIGPHDEGISRSILANLEPKSWAITEPLPSDTYIVCTDAIRKAYFAHLATMNLTKEINAKINFKIVNTSMHGVSDDFIREGFALFSLPPYLPVREQQDPDPEFPTVKFPNPEEKGALDLALSCANKEGAAYIFAQDPDSDRFAAAEKGHDGKWMVFSGDQLGTLFASQTLAIYKASGKPIENLAMVASTVSSKMIEAMARIEGFKFSQCLTGFKYIGNLALELAKQGYDVPFAYEEAIGFMFGSIRDKDGVAATLSFAELVASLRSEGKTVYSYLQGLYDKYGYFQTANGYFSCNDPGIITAIFERIRHFNVAENSATLLYPKQIAGFAIKSVIDFTTGYDSTNPPTYKTVLPISSGNMIQFKGGNQGGVNIVLTIRTSGTEPKIKFYLEGSGKDRDTVSALLPNVVAELGDNWLEADKHNLGPPHV